jgi:hypothetical protein
MRRTFYLLSSPGGRIAITFTTLVFGVVTDARGVQLGHDIAIGSLGALLAQLNFPGNFDTKELGGE